VHEPPTAALQFFDTGSFGPGGWGPVPLDPDACVSRMET
jgi:hypothetical protein